MFVNEQHSQLVLQFNCIQFVSAFHLRSLLLLCAVNLVELLHRICLFVVQYILCVWCIIELAVLCSYVLSVVDKLVVDDYVLVYMHSGAPRNSMPGLQWFHKFYRMIDRRWYDKIRDIMFIMCLYCVRLRKNLKHLYIVHPTFWVKTMLRLARPFIRWVENVSAYD